MTSTPGPWQYEATTKTIRSHPANYWLASMDSWDGAVDNEANAALIASAPDLLAALEAEMAKDRKRYGNSPEAIAFFELNNAETLALIAKAKGIKE